MHGSSRYLSARDHEAKWRCRRADNGSPLTPSRFRHEGEPEMRCPARHTALDDGNTGPSGSLTEIGHVFLRFPSQPKAGEGEGGAARASFFDVPLYRRGAETKKRPGETPGPSHDSEDCNGKGRCMRRSGVGGAEYPTTSSQSRSHSCDLKSRLTGRLVRKSRKKDEIQRVWRV